MENVPSEEIFIRYEAEDQERREDALESLLAAQETRQLILTWQ